MKIILLTVFISFAVLSCTRKGVITTWNAGQVQTAYRKMLVVGVFHDTGQQFRSRMEQHFVRELGRYGYEAESALDVFGPGGLSNMEQEETYIRLYSNGYDALVTIALIDKEKEAHYPAEKTKYHSSHYFYNRIWNYKFITADLIKKETASSAAAYRWESIFFNLKTLSPLYAVQTRSFKPLTTENNAGEFGLMLVAQMHKHKVITKQNAARNNLLKPF